MILAPELVSSVKSGNLRIENQIIFERFHIYISHWSSTYDNILLISHMYSPNAYLNMIKKDTDLGYSTSPLMQKDKFTRKSIKLFITYYA